MRKVILVTFKYPPVYSGYGKQLQLVTEDILKNRKEELTFTILTAYENSNASSTPGLEVISLLDKADNETNKDVFPFSLEVMKWLYKNRKQYDVIHCLKAGPEAVASNIISKLTGKPLIVKVVQDELTEREIISVSGFKKMSRLVRHKLLLKVPNFIAISEEIESKLKDKVDKKTRIIRIPNGVDSEKKFVPVSHNEKSTLRNQLSIPEDEVVLLYAGAINKRKGIPDLLNALEKYDSRQFLRVIMCGPVLEDIGFVEKLENINKKENIQIDYRGRVTNIEVFMKASDMFILPSYSEGLPNVLLEAASTGLPLIATNIGGSRDIVSKGNNGYLIETNSPDEMMKRITVMAEQSELREEMGKKSRKRVINNFAISKVSKAYSLLYNNLY